MRALVLLVMTGYTVCALAAEPFAVVLGVAQTTPDPTEEPAPPATPPKAPSLLAPLPRSDEFDWMQFNNGEWLKGEIKDLQDDSFEFESDELDTFNLDWDDIQALYSKKLNTIMLIDKTVLEGTVKVEGDVVTITTDDGVHTYSREQVRSIMPGRRTERNHWSGKLSFGSTIRRGNVNQTDVTMSLLVVRRDVDSRFKLDYNGAFSEVEGTVTADNQRAAATYDIYTTPRFFIRPAALTTYRDRFQNIDYRITPSAGLGYDLVDKDGLEWYVFGGVGWEFTRFYDPLPGAPPDQNSVAALIGTELAWEATSKIDVGFEFNLTMPVPETNNYNFRTALTTEVELWGDFDLEIQLIWDRVNNAAPGADLTIPQPDDVRMFVGIGWEF